MKCRDLLHIVQHIDLIRPLCNHVLGEKHTIVHRKVAGFFTMVGGVVLSIGVSEYAHSFEIIGHLVGYALHGIGLMPFIEHEAEKISNKNIPQ